MAVFGRTIKPEHFVHFVHLTSFFTYGKQEKIVKICRNTGKKKPASGKFYTFYNTNRKLTRRASF